MTLLTRLQNLTSVGSHSLSPHQLLDAQLYCWGRDIERADGNGLLAFGFSRRPPPHRRKTASSIYLLNQGSSPWIMLRGFGIAVARLEGPALFVDRQSARPKLAIHREALLGGWLRDDLPPLVTPRSRTDREMAAMLFGECCRWIAVYENWARARWGKTYRQECLQLWPGMKRIAGRRIVLEAAWRAMAA